MCAHARGQKRRRTASFERSWPAEGNEIQGASQCLRKFRVDKQFDFVYSIGDLKTCAEQDTQETDFGDAGAGCCGHGNSEVCPARVKSSADLPEMRRASLRGMLCVGGCVILSTVPGVHVRATTASVSPNFLIWNNAHEHYNILPRKGYSSQSKSGFAPTTIQEQEAHAVDSGITTVPT